MITMETVQMQFDFSNLMPAEETQIIKSGSRDTAKFVFEMMDMLTAPIITYSTSWAEAIPPKLKQDIKMSRLIGALKKEELATIPETVAYIITRTYEAPLCSEWTNIYLWCSSEYLKQFRDKTDEDLKEIQPPKNLSEYEQTLLKRLRVWIYEKRREAVKQQLKQNGQEANNGN